MANRFLLNSLTSAIEVNILLACGSSLDTAVGGGGSVWPTLLNLGLDILKFLHYEAFSYSEKQINIYQNSASPTYF